jgi:hypothetical protein
MPRVGGSLPVPAILGENLIKAGSATEAIEQLLRRKIAVIFNRCLHARSRRLSARLNDPRCARFQTTAIIFGSAIQVIDLDLLRGYEPAPRWR